MTPATERSYPDPAIDPESRPFWDASAEGRLLLKHCRGCGKTHYYPRTICPHCFCDDTQWQAASGRGTIYSYSVARRADPPYAIAYVSLEEGVTVLTNIVECDLDALQIGQAVELAFRKTQGGASLPVFRPAARAEGAR